LCCLNIISKQNRWKTDIRVKARSRRKQDKSPCKNSFPTDVFELLGTKLRCTKLAYYKNNLDCSNHTWNKCLEVFQVRRREDCSHEICMRIYGYYRRRFTKNGKKKLCWCIYIRVRETRRKVIFKTRSY
jgi:hypothetical protein